MVDSIIVAVLVEGVQGEMTCQMRLMSRFDNEARSCSMTILESRWLSGCVNASRKAAAEWSVTDVGKRHRGGGESLPQEPISIMPSFTLCPIVFTDAANEFYNFFLLMEFVIINETEQALELPKHFASQECQPQCFNNVTTKIDEAAIQSQHHAG